MAEGIRCLLVNHSTICLAHLGCYGNKTAGARSTPDSDLSMKDKQTMRDHAFSIAIRRGYFTAEQAKEYRYHGCRQTNERTTHYFSLPDGYSIAVPE